MFKPGYLTLAYNTGHRASYVNPFRLYLIMSLLMFTVTSFDHISKDGDLDGVEVNETLQLPMGVEIEPEIKELDSGTQLNAINATDTTKTVKKKKKAREDEEEFKIGWGLNVKDDSAWNRLFADTVLKKSDFYPKTEEDVDSVLKHYGFTNHLLNRILIKQGLKAYNDTQSLNEYAKSKLPSTMFFMLPFYTIMIQLIYSRRKFYYQEHLVHTFNVHSFLFFIISILYFVYLMNWVDDFPLGAMLILTGVHVYLSMRTVYLQSHLKTSLKFLLLVFSYLLVFLIAIAINVGVSFLLF